MRGVPPISPAVEIDGAAVTRELRRVGGCLLHLGRELVHAGHARARCGLVGADDQAPQAGRLVQRLERGHRGHGRAIRIRDDPFRNRRERVRVHLGDDERNVGIHAPGRRIVDDHGSRRRHDGRELAGGRRAGGEEDDVEAGVVGGRRVLDDDLFALPWQTPAGRARRGKQAERLHGEVALGQNRKHQVADQPGGTDDPDTQVPRMRLWRRTHCIRCLPRCLSPGQTRPLAASAMLAAPDHDPASVTPGVAGSGVGRGPHAIARRGVAL